jgi:hypothetical protein
MPNPFDVFDAPAQPTMAGPNPFDAFDARAKPEEKPKAAVVSGAMSPYGLNRGQTPAFEPTALPAPVAKMGREAAIYGGLTAVGQGVGSMFGPAGTAGGGALGGGAAYLTNQLISGESPTLGGAASAMATSAIPFEGIGASMAKGPVTRALTSAPVQQAIVGAAAPQIQSYMDTGEAAPLLSSVEGAAGAYVGGKIGEKLAGGATKPAPATPLSTVTSEIQKNFNVLQPEGIKLPPFMLQKGGNTGQSLAGKAAMAQQANVENIPQFHRLAKQEIGLSGYEPVKPGTPEGDKVIQGLLDVQYKPYEQMREIVDKAKSSMNRMVAKAEEQKPTGEFSFSSTQTQKRYDKLANIAEADVDKWRLAGEEARNAWDKFTNKQIDYPTYKAAVDNFENFSQKFETAAKFAKRPELAEQLAQAKTKIAKIYDFSNSLNPATGISNPGYFGAKVAFKEPLSGNFKKIGDFQLSFDKAARELTKVPAPGVDNMKLGMALQSMAHGNPVGAGTGVLQSMGAPLRNYYMSPGYQAGMMAPETISNFLPSATGVGNAGANFMRYLPQQAINQLNQPNP